MDLSKNFTLEQMVESSTARRKNFHEQFMPGLVIVNAIKLLVVNVLQPLADGISPSVIHIDSGYRCPRLNAAVGGVPSSQHLEGKAADIVVAGMTNVEIMQKVKALDLSFDQMIEEFGSWVHISYNSAGSNRRQILRAMKVNGQTKYLPVSI